MIFFVVSTLIILFAIAITGVIILVLMVLGRMRTNVPYLRVPHKIIPEIVLALALTENARVYDLGCGDTKVLRQILSSSLNARGVGIEIAPLPYTIARLWNIIKPQPRMTIMYKNFFNVSVSDSTHVFMYLFNETMDSLLPKLTSELKIGARIVSCDFKFSNKTPSQTIAVQTSKTRTHKLFVYTF